MGSRFKVPKDMVVQAFQFTLDLADDKASVVRRQFGGRRYAYNWAVRTIKADVSAYRVDGAGSPAPSLAGLRKRWNQVKDAECADAGTGEAWWPEISKEAFADGIAGAVNAYWNWQQSRAGDRKGRRVGFPRFKKKGRDRDRVTFTTGAIRVEPDRRHVTLPRIGTVRTCENTRRLERLIAKGRARILATIRVPQGHTDRGGLPRPGLTTPAALCHRSRLGRGRRCRRAGARHCWSLGRYRPRARP